MRSLSILCFVTFAGVSASSRKGKSKTRGIANKPAVQERQLTDATLLNTLAEEETKVEILTTIPYESTQLPETTNILVEYPEVFDVLWNYSEDILPGQPDEYSSDLQEISLQSVYGARKVSNISGTESGTRRHEYIGSNEEKQDASIEFDEADILDVDLEGYVEEEPNMLTAANRAANELLLASRPHKEQLVRMSEKSLAVLQAKLGALADPKQLEVFTTQAGHLYVRAEELCQITREKLEQIPWADIQLALLHGALTTAQGTAMVVSTVGGATQTASRATVKFAFDVATSPITQGIISGVGTGIIYANLGVIASLQLVLNIAKPAVDSAADALRNHLNGKSYKKEDPVGTAVVISNPHLYENEEDGDDF